jgi:hypothetical protein
MLAGLADNCDASWSLRTLQVLVGSPTSSMLHVFQLKSTIPAFSMFVVQDTPAHSPPAGSAIFTVPDHPGQVQLWLHDQLACEVDLGADGGGRADFLCLRDGCPLVVEFGALASAQVSLHTP